MFALLPARQSAWPNWHSPVFHRGRGLCVILDMIETVFVIDTQFWQPLKHLDNAQYWYARN
jgi:hypothetical protein